MKKYLSLFFFLLIINFNSSLSYSANYLVGDKLQNVFDISKRIKIPLNSGEWEVIRYQSATYGSLIQKLTGICRIQNNEVLECIEVYEGLLGGIAIGHIDPIINELQFLDKHDGCYERPEYYSLDLYHKGSTHNCMIIRHMDVKKELYNPDGDHAKLRSIAYRKAIKEKSIVFPPIMLQSYHSYFSRLVAGNWYEIGYFVNPKILNAPEIKKLTEETSEYHKFNISNYPEHKKIMDLWSSISAKRHQDFEIMVRAKNKHLLDLSKYKPLEYETSNKDKSNVSDQLKQINELFKAGVLTKEEFEKAKKKILN